MSWIVGGLLFAVGLCIGSFLNVVIVRWPEGRSIVSPPSACPRCGAAIAWHDNVPVVSFLILRGRCRRCRAPISWRYPAIEALTGGLFVLVYAVRGLGPDLVPALAFTAALVTITVIDFDHHLIPDVISLPGVVVGVAASLLTGRPTWIESTLGVLAGAGPFLLIVLATAGRGMGVGDIKLGAMLGAFLGWKVALVALFLGVLTGGSLAVVLLALGRKGRKDAVPFGPFLALGGLLGLLWGDRLLAWYLGVL